MKYFVNIVYSGPEAEQKSFKPKPWSPCQREDGKCDGQCPHQGGGGRAGGSERKQAKV